jgi:hypothetical protein
LAGDTVPEDLVDILYSCIDEIGREKIRIDITSNIGASKKYCMDIIAKSTSKLGPEADDEMLGTLCEATLHFMLTVSLLPSERKVNVKGAELDLVIPSQKMLDRQPERALVIQVIKNSSDTAKIKHAGSVQPHRGNIWIVSAKPILAEHRNYHLGSGNFSYPELISDINAFLVDKKVKGLKLLHGQ